MRKFLGVVLVAVSSLFQTGLAQDTTRLSLLFVGDIMQHDTNIAAAFDPVTKKYDYTACFQFMAPLLRSADLTIGNLELTLAGAPYKGYPQFSAPDALAVALKDIGFDVLVTANNHSVDRGKKGIDRTIKVLDSLNIQHTGTFADTTSRRLHYPLIVERKGFRLSLLNYTYGTNGIPVPKTAHVNLMDTLTIRADLQKAKQQNTDAIIVFFHWGDEYQSLPNTTQKFLAAWCLKRGVSLVIGSHPHVLQPIEWRKNENQVVAYSLGNFISGQRPRYRDGGALLWIDLEKIKNDSTSSTLISKVEHELEWVYKTPTDAKFYMLPLRNFENDTTVVVEKSIRDVRALFKDDARALLSKHNLNVPERLVVEDSAYYKIELVPNGELDAENTKLKFYGFEKDERDSLFWVGMFYDAELAEQALKEVIESIPYKKAIVRKFLVR